MFVDVSLYLRIRFLLFKIYVCECSSSTRIVSIYVRRLFII